MDKASASGAGDSRFESLRDRFYSYVGGLRFLAGLCEC